MQEDISFGEWVRQRRHILDLTQQELADQVGCARITLRRIESGALKPSRELAQILLEKLGAPSKDETWLRFARGLSGFPGSPASKPVTNLPSSLTSFIGREMEIDEVANLIAKNRLVTLAGAGGIGKTRLSLQVGQKLLNDYPNGIWFVALDSLSDPALVPQAVASVFGIREGSSDQPILERLTYSLHQKTALLIFDNCEHLLDACAQLLKDLLTHCPNLKVLTTSREVLGLEGEIVYYLPPLSAPTTLDLASTESLAQYESIRLFIQRAQLTRTHFSMTAESVPFLIEICQLLDGIPLALELAAAHVDILQLKEMLKQLNEHFDLLASNLRAAIPRHQTMRASLDWSWELLSEAEQTFMRQLSVFGGGWTLEAAQAVCEGNTLNLISALVKKSLIVVNQQSGYETRYGFHEIVRQYADEKLVESDEEENIRTRHLKYFLQLSEQAESGLRGTEEVKWFSRLFDERDNIRAALAWADKTDNVEKGLYISGRLDRFWDSFDMREGSNWLGEFLRKPESKTFPIARARALCTQGWLLEWMQRSAEARSAAQECLDLYQACGDREGEVEGLLLLGFISEAPKSVELNLQALTLAQSLGDTWRQAKAFTFLGWTDGYDFKKRVGYWEKAISLFRRVSDLRFLAGQLATLGNFLALNGDIEPAQKCLDESTLLLQQLNSKNLIWHNNKGGYVQIALMRGDYDQARALLQAIQNLSQENGDRMTYLWTRVRLAYLDLHDGKISEARHAFSENAQSFQKNENTIGVVFTLEGMAKLCVTAGKPERAAQLIGWTDTTREEISDMRPLLEQADVDKIISACLAKMGETAFSDAYEEGQKMTLDEAVAYALSES